MLTMLTNKQYGYFCVVLIHMMVLTVTHWQLRLGIPQLGIPQLIDPLRPIEIHTWSQI